MPARHASCPDPIPMSEQPSDGNTTLAAIDLGSNSFHMIVALADDQGFRVVDRMRSSVRLAAGLDRDKNITPKAMNRALACLDQFGERIGDLPG